MKTLLNENKGIQYEAFLLLSLYIMLPKSNEKATQILQTNKKHLNEFIKTFQNERGKYNNFIDLEEEEFYALKNKMRECLDILE